jgi:hypothetical protein
VLQLLPQCCSPRRRLLLLPPPPCRRLLLVAADGGEGTFVLGVGLPLLALSRDEVLGRHAPGAMSVAAWSSFPVQLSLEYCVKLTMTTTPSSVPAQHSPVCGSTARAVMEASATDMGSAATAALWMWYTATAPLL